MIVMHAESSQLLSYSTNSADYCVVYVTCEQESHAKILSDSLVQESLAACVNMIGPIASTYRWQENIEHAQEWLLIIKTTTTALERLNHRIHELHTYTVPEVIAIPIIAGSSNYLSWIRENVHLS